jgi:uracil-DNA glycosylase
MRATGSGCGARIVAAVRCAPPANKPTPRADTCQPWLLREFELAAPTIEAVVGLGQYAWQAALRALRHRLCPARAAAGLRPCRRS